MPWTLYRYILKDLIRLLVLSSAVLVLVISFAAAIKPLSDGLLDPLSLIKFVLLSIPTMLTLVMPFAGAFASTMLFCRMASENEVTACATSGMSYRAIVLPVFLLGLGVSVGLYYMSNWLVPWFFRQSALMVQEDITTVLLNNVRSGRPVPIPGKEGWVVFADNADSAGLNLEPRAGGVTPYEVISLQGVALGRFDNELKLRNHTTAEQADVFLYRSQQRHWAILRTKGATAYLQDKGVYVELAGGESLAFELPNPFEHDLRFLSWPQLSKLARRPDTWARAGRSKSRLALAIARHRMVGRMMQQLGGGRLELHSESDQRYAITAEQFEFVPAADVDQWHLLLKGNDQSPVTVIHSARHLPQKTFKCHSATISPMRDDGPIEPAVELELIEPQILDLQAGGQRSDRKHYTIRRLTSISPLLSPLEDLPAAGLVAQAGDLADVPQVAAAADGLTTVISKLRRKITAQVHERFALAITSLMVLLLGAVLSVKLRGSMPLVVYFWTFLLTSLAVFIARSGENYAADVDHSLAGSMMLIWLGNALLLAAVGGVYYKLAKN